MNNYIDKFKDARDLRISKRTSTKAEVDFSVDEKWQTLVQISGDVKEILTAIGAIEWGKRLWSKNYKILFPSVLSRSPDVDTLKKLNQCVWILEHSLRVHSNKSMSFSTYELYTLTIKFDEEGVAVKAIAEGKDLFETSNTSINGLTDIFTRVIETGPDVDTHYSY